MIPDYQGNGVATSPYTQLVWFTVKHANDSTSKCTDLLKLVSSCKKVSSPGYTWWLSSTFMELKVQTAATFDDTEIYRTHTYWFYQQFSNIKGFSGFLRMITPMKTVNTRPFLSSHAAWIWGYVNIYMNTTEMGDDNPKKDYIFNNSLGPIHIQLKKTQKNILYTTFLWQCYS